MTSVAEVSYPIPHIKVLPKQSVLMHPLRILGEAPVLSGEPPLDLTHFLRWAEMIIDNSQI